MLPITGQLLVIVGPLKCKPLTLMLLKNLSHHIC